ncbi:hypothetical protein [Aurantimonas sp. 22II-16-19i]|uniref:hypothetical protein n=1 Tax=Aurantimonas sp. 22II-16-19i TaxID=1317114 RepID=UPI0009F7E93D|nr:hypothetical protein [Aurantimonas sp. 22II-16-19i]ORE87821.1 hypothetical protein ATO4_25058 [Aurantimonas sp. 22II-16-19i]
MANFRLVETYLYWWPVTVHIPDPTNAGQTIEQTFEMQFEAMPIEEAEKLDRDFMELKTAEERSTHEHDLLKRVSKNWRGVEAAGGGDEPFTSEAFEKAIRFPWFRIATYRAYARSISGEARAGN